MIKSNANDIYFRNKVLTATPAELVLLLYDGFIKFGNMSIRFVNDKDFDSANKYILKMEAIIDELSGTLDRKYEVSKDFDNIYSYVSRRLIEANINKDSVILEECITHIRSLRETWTEVMRIAR